MAKIALFAGTFDPITKGHLDLIKRSVQLFDTLIVGVAEHSGKNPIFSLEERVRLVKTSLSLPKVNVQSFSGLLTDFAREQKVNLLVRGLRSMGDAHYEMQLAQTYQLLMPELEILWLPASPLYSMIASSLVREIAALNGDLAPFVPETVIQALQQQFAKR